MSLIQPSGDGPAKVTQLGWFHPDGPNYTASLFADDTGRFLMGVGRGDWDQPYVWIVYDLQNRTHSVAPFEAAEPEALDLRRASLYGSQTRDNAGNCYVVGLISGGRFGNDSRPILVQVRPAR